ncbi:hypothetical protein, partial [Tianweitania sp.]|uniref:hypothetical protein n=1 Tax=Tianweitania sp. TaxID=2021634 RepID=UPI002896405E
CSEHVLRVVPKESRISPGYLYAFLSSSYGVPLVVSGTYGAVIQHIEPKHIADLPVPRFGEVFENGVGAKMDEAAQKLSNGQRLLEEATDLLFSKTGVSNPNSCEWKKDSSDLGFEVASNNAEPLRAWNHSLRVRRITDEIERGDFSLLADLVDMDWLRWRVMFKRIDADKENGIEVL